MAEQTIVIKITGKNLVVPKRKLTKDSLKFRQLFDELNLAEHEIYDFSPEVVEYFIDLVLGNKKLYRIKTSIFRELHKLSVVFEVQWLKDKCRGWLFKKIKNVRYEEDKTFLFKECWYILDKCKDETMMDELVSKLAHENNLDLLTYYLSDISQIETGQIDVLLKLGGWNAKPFLENILHNLAGQKTLNTNVKYLLESMNLAFCSETNEELYLEVMDKISRLTEITFDDMKFVNKLALNTARSVRSRKKKPRTVELMKRSKSDTYNNSERCDTRSETEDEVPPSIMFLIEQLLKKCCFDKPDTEELKVFVESLEKLCDEKKFRKAPRKYLECHIAALACSTHKNSNFLLKFLKEIKSNKKLSTNNEFVTMKAEKVISRGRDKMELYKFKHPLSATCTRSDSKCGFILQGDQLCTKEEHYAKTGIHLHSCISPRDMLRYTSTTFRHEYELITVLDMGVNWWFEYWYPENSFESSNDAALFKSSFYRTNGRMRMCILNHYNIAYDLTSYLVAK